MGKTLVIVESPSKAKTIEKFLGKNKYEVLASVGHVRDLPKSQLGIDVENDFAMKYITIRGKGDKIKELKKAASKADNVLLAPDPDREGEAISWHLADELDVDLNELNRVEFHEITKDAVLEAFKHPRKVDMDLVHSQETRRILDRIIGFKLSKLLHSKIKSKSAGRVQSVALKLIVEREKEWNLASIYYREVNGVKEVFDIHYHKNSHINGKRTEEQVIEETTDENLDDHGDVL